MTPQRSGRPPERRGPSTATLAAIAAAMLVALVGLYAFGGRQGPEQQAAAPTEEPQPTGVPTLTAAPTGTATPTATLTPRPTASPTATATPQPTPIVIDRRRVGEQAFLKARMSDTLVLTQENLKIRGVTLPGGRDTITVVYVADVKLGLLTDQITYDVRGASVTVTLPQPTVLSVEPDWQASRILEANQSIFGSKIAQLEQEAWAQAQANIRVAATNDQETLAEARRVAADSIELQLRRLGFQEVKIVYR